MMKNIHFLLLFMIVCSCFKEERQDVTVVDTKTIKICDEYKIHSNDSVIKILYCDDTIYTLNNNSPKLKYINNVIYYDSLSRACIFNNFSDNLNKLNIDTKKITSSFEFDVKNRIKYSKGEKPVINRVKDYYTLECTQNYYFFDLELSKVFSLNDEINYILRAPKYFTHDIASVDSYSYSLNNDTIFFNTEIRTHNFDISPINVKLKYLITDNRKLKLLDKTIVDNKRDY